MSVSEVNSAEMAIRFINSTGSHIFLTGKAGTGKTTLLLDLAAKTHKQFVVVAPTGIAALNAGGVTIHSQFLFPLGSFIPDHTVAGQLGDRGGFFTRQTLARRHPLNSIRKQVLRAIDLLVIDEVSMLRADLLDAIDYRMRSIKGNFHQSFGGTQVLMIGDLYQLPPIVKDEEWSVLQRYYPSMHFFEAHALRDDGLVYIELDKIYRQEDDAFIGILNNLRNNVVTDKDIQVLNQHYTPAEQADDEEEVITITTHNYRADSINTKNLAALPGKVATFEADITGDFPEHLYPIARVIELKPGARVMFVRNDSSGEGMYYNGKLATVDSIDGDEVTARMADSGDIFVLRKERWENRKYSIDEESKELEEDVVGTFEQYPVKPAWAVTVHKSQGLTFDRAVIDVGRAFAPGQVYVALSRLRSLDGLVLRTKINTNSLGSDVHVVTFAQDKEQQPPLPEILQEKQRRYLQHLLANTFDFTDIEKQLAYLKRGKSGSMEFEEKSMQRAMQDIEKRFLEERKNTDTFRKQLTILLDRQDKPKLVERIGKGSAYYRAFLEENLKMLLEHQAEVESYTRTKTYLNALAEIDQLIMKNWDQVEKAGHVTQCILSGDEILHDDSETGRRAERRTALLEQARKRVDENPKFSSRKSGRKRKKRKKGETYATTYSMLAEGLGIEDIATKRGMAVSTIEGHIARGISKEQLRIHDMVSDDIVEEISEKIRENEGSLNAVFRAFDGRHSYGLLRMVQAHISRD